MIRMELIPILFYKKSVFVGLLSILVFLSGCSYFKPAPTAHSMTTQQLPNGQTRIVSMPPSNPVPLDRELLQQLDEKQTVLQSLIAEELGLNGEDVLVKLSQTSLVAQNDIYELTCSVILNTAATFKDKQKNIDEVVDQILNTVTEAAINTKISSENISIMNNEGVQLNSQY